MNIIASVGAGLACVGLLLLPIMPASAEDLRSAVEQLAAEIARSAPEGRQLRVAVADFPDLQGVTSDLGRYIGSRLTTRLAQERKFFVIERQRLGQVLAELKFSMSDLVDPSKAKQLGKMLGVEALIVGSVADLGNVVDVDARMIEIETNRMVLGATVSISKDPTVTDMLERGRQETVTTTPTPGIPSSAGKPAPGPKALRRVELDNFIADLNGCRSSGTAVRCDLTITNATHDLRHLRLLGHPYGNASRLYDNLGNEYVAQRLKLGPKSSTGTGDVTHTLAPQVAVPASLEFTGVSPQAIKAVVLTVHGYAQAQKESFWGEVSWEVKFSDVAIQK